MTTSQTLIASCAIALVAAVAWRIYRRRRPHGEKSEFVYMNQDGTVRELAPGEVEYLSEEFFPGDSGRPYIKPDYRSRDGWGSLSGFILRSKVPRHIEIAPVNPNYKGDESLSIDGLIQDAVAVGDVVTHNEDDSVTIEPNPNFSTKERYARATEIQICQQAAREEAARFPKGQ